MFNADEFYRNIERKMLVNPLRSTGEMENSFWQHIGKYYNKALPYPGQTNATILANVERIMTGQKPHGYQQNKKTELEKLQEKGVKNAGS